MGFAAGLAPEIRLSPHCKKRSSAKSRSNLTISPGESAASTRQVSPLALVNHEGRWHLYSHETSTDQFKTFLLRRMVSTVRPLDTPAVDSPESVTQEALADLADLYQRQVATLEVRPDSDAWSALSQRRDTEIGPQHLDVHYTDVDILLPNSPR